MEKYKGVVFDFNGTLLWDTRLHNEAWDIFLSRHRISLSDQQKNEVIHGRNNSLIIPGLFGPGLTGEEVRRFISQKESIYQDLCLKKGIDYAPGARDFIGYLKSGKIRYSIATASGKENVDFYFARLGLGSLIEREYVIYDNNRIRSKPDPEIFQIAINKLNLMNGDVVIFEDSYAGILAAQHAKPGKIIIVNSTQADYRDFRHKVITSFDEVDRGMFSI
jgi:beta-phosphoglucomutase